MTDWAGSSPARTNRHTNSAASFRAIFCLETPLFTATYNYTSRLAGEFLDSICTVFQTMARAKTLFLLYSAWRIVAQAAETTYTIQTIAGSNLVGDGGASLAAQIADAQGVAIDRQGAVYIADP